MELCREAMSVAEPFADPRDWAELCVSFGRKAREWELTPTQYLVVASVLGLDRPEPTSDEELERVVVPAVLDAMRRL